RHSRFLLSRLSFERVFASVCIPSRSARKQALARGGAASMRGNSMQLSRRILLGALFVAGAGALAQAQEIPAARVAPAPSQVEPPRLPAAPRIAPEIPSVQPPEAPAFPKDAEKLSFVLLGFDIEGEFEEFVATSRELAAPLIGKRVTVAQVFDFATQLQA